MMKTFGVHSPRCTYFAFGGFHGHIFFASKCAEGRRLVMVLGDTSMCDEHSEWVEEAVFRRNLVSVLEEEGLEASFEADHDMLPDGPDYGPLLRDSPKTGKCWLVTGYNPDVDKSAVPWEMLWEVPVYTGDRAVLRVEIPRAPKKQCTA